MNFDELPRENMAVKAFECLWHKHFGHVSNKVVKESIRRFNLPAVMPLEINVNHVWKEKCTDSHTNL